MSKIFGYQNVFGKFWKNKMIEQHKLLLSNVDNNNNKFWMASLEDDSSVHIHWGRVGTTGATQDKKFSDISSAQHFIQTKIKEKLNKGYQKIEMVSSVIDTSSLNLSSIAKKQIKSDNDSETMKLIELLSKENVHNILSKTVMKYEETTGLFSTPLGIVNRAVIEKARDLLTNMAIYVKNQDFQNSEYKKMINQYLTYIPSKVNHKLRADTFLVDLDDVQKQNDILDALMFSYEQYELQQKTNIDKSVDELPSIFNCSVNLVKDLSIIDRIKQKFMATRRDGHSCRDLKIHKIYEINIDCMNKEFNDKGKKLGNIKELWHGTKISNILSILKNGMIIIPSTSAYVTGRMFGNGIYFSDISTKALNYSYGFWDNTKNNHCYMFLADVAMGKEYIPSGSGESLPKPGYDSTFAKEKYSGVINNEMIVPNVHQVNLKYLVEFKN